jgi:hypothetical protein
MNDGKNIFGYSVEEVDITSKVKKSKRHEMEPSMDSILLNISRSSDLIFFATTTLQPTASATSQTENTKEIKNEDINLYPLKHAYEPVKSWFSFESCHEIEKRALNAIYKTPTFTISDYIKNRNMIISKYQKNPLVYLTVGAVYRDFWGSLEDLLNIHSLLERWSLINFNVITHALCVPKLNIILFVDCSYV